MVRLWARNTQRDCVKGSHIVEEDRDMVRFLTHHVSSGCIQRGAAGQTTQNPLLVQDQLITVQRKGRVAMELIDLAVRVGDASVERPAPLQIGKRRQPLPITH